MSKRKWSYHRGTNGYIVFDERDRIIAWAYTEEHARMMAASLAMYEALEAVEWEATDVDADGEWSDCCPMCGRFRHDDHDAECPIAYALMLAKEVQP